MESIWYRFRSSPTKSVGYRTDQWLWRLRKHKAQGRNAQGDEALLWRIPLDHQSIDDISISKAAKLVIISYLLLAPLTRGNTAGKTIVSRVNVNTHVCSRIVLNIGSGQPTITIGKSPFVKGENLGSSESLYLGASNFRGQYICWMSNHSRNDRVLNCEPLSLKCWRLIMTCSVSQI